MAKGTALLSAITGAKKPKVFQVPKPKEPKGHGLAAPSSDYYWPPNLYLSEKDFPGIEAWKAGDVVNLAITAKVGGISINESEKGKRSYHTDLTITAIADLGGKK